MNKKILRSIIVIIRTIRGKGDNKNYTLLLAKFLFACGLILSGIGLC